MIAVAILLVLLVVPLVVTALSRLMHGMGGVAVPVPIPVPVAATPARSGSLAR
ncbi:MAG: hypothetical protein JNK45_27715 [Myxococcales bacterium]|jgi:hypothetical protein|nr:hypothetical protein [Myxococcales bacterium]